MSDTILGRCKWYSDKKGYGFIVVSEGPDKDSEVFVHHRQIKPLVSTRKVLRKGEYVSMMIGNDDNNRPCALDVTGVQGGPLMCDHFISNTKRETSTQEPAIVLDS